jgi:hypothetical protein
MVLAIHELRYLCLIDAEQRGDFALFELPPGHSSSSIFKAYL